MQADRLDREFRRALDAVRGNLDIMVQALRDKGARHFARPLGVAVAAVYAAHLFSQSLASRQKALDMQLAGARATSQYARRYQELQGVLQGVTANLPNPKNRDNWLLNTALEAMRAEGILSTALRPVTQTAQGDFVFLSLSITCRASYKQLARWVDRLERSKVFLHVTSLTLSKDAADIGMNQVSLTVGAVFPKDGSGS